METIVYGSSIKGNGHFVNGVECQDSNSFEETDFNNDDIKIIAISDGHGGAPYFRSSIGSKYAVRIAKKTMYEFISSHKEILDEISLISEENCDIKNENLSDLASKKAISKKKINNLKKENEKSNVEKNVLKKTKLIADINKDFKLLKADILTEWRFQIDKELSLNPVQILLAEEFKKIETLTDDSKNKKISFSGFCMHDKEGKEINLLTKSLDSTMINSILKNPRQLYGATLICCGTYKKHIFMIQIGDGDIIMLKPNGTIFTPVEKFSNQLANETNSICQLSAINRFNENYLYDDFKMIMLSTDGVVNSLEEENELNDLANGIYESLIIDSENFRGDFKPLLRRFSEGSTDDCTISFIAQHIPSKQYKIIKESQEVEEENDLSKLYKPKFKNYNLNSNLYLTDDISEDGENNIFSTDNIFKKLNEIFMDTCNEFKNQILNNMNALTELNKLSLISKVLLQYKTNIEKQLNEKLDECLNKLNLDYLSKVDNLLSENPIIFIKFSVMNINLNDNKLETNTENTIYGIVSTINDGKIKYINVDEKLYSNKLINVLDILKFKDCFEIDNSNNLSVENNKIILNQGGK